MNPVGPGHVLPAPLAERRIVAADSIEDIASHVDHVATRGVVGDVTIILVQDFDLPLRNTLRLVEDRHQVWLRRVHVRLPPAIDQRVSVVIKQKKVLAAAFVQQLQALVLGPRYSDVLLEPVVGPGDGRPGSIIDNNNIDAWRMASNLLRSEEHTSELQSRGHL